MLGNTNGGRLWHDIDAFRQRGQKFRNKLFKRHWITLHCNTTPRTHPGNQAYSARLWHKLLRLDLAGKLVANYSVPPKKVIDPFQLSLRLTEIALRSQR